MGEVDPDGDVAGLDASITGFDALAGFAVLMAFDAFTDLEVPMDFDAFADLDHSVVNLWPSARFEKHCRQFACATAQCESR